MLFLIVFICAVIVSVVLGLMAAWSDFRGMKIPNSYSLGIIVAFGFAYSASALANQEGVFQVLNMHLLIGATVFIVTFTLCALKTLGGGDSKLLTAFALWSGLKYIVIFLFIMAVAGFFLAIAAIIVREKKPFKQVKEGTWVARAQAGQAVIPYGIPITIGALYMFWVAGYWAPETLVGFLAWRE